MKSAQIVVVIPNWNGADSLEACLKSLRAQTQSAEIIVVDNGSTDGSVSLLKNKFPDVIVLEQSHNLGFAGGVNVGIGQAIDNGANYVALFNNDAVADKDWLAKLVSVLDKNKRVGIVTCKLMDAEKSHLDSTGDFYTTWGLPYPRGRGEPVSSEYDKDTIIFSASGGASLYRVNMFKQIGLFDRSFFAYYEDIDLSFRAQLAGWQISYNPEAFAYHQIGATSSKIKGFTTYQTMKNLPMVVRKNVPLQLLPTILPRFWLAYMSFYFSAMGRGQIWPATRGCLAALAYLPKNLWQRWQIQKSRQVSVNYIKGLLIYDLPPSAVKLRKLRAKWWRLIGKRLYG